MSNVVCFIALTWTAFCGLVAVALVGVYIWIHNSTPAWSTIRSPHVTPDEDVA